MTGWTAAGCFAREYPLRAEVAHLYPDELRMAQQIVDFVNVRLEDPLPGDEAVAVALHLIDAGFCQWGPVLHIPNDGGLRAAL
ncbi:MAG TPA: PRD domain-containing protein [Arthrobacter sp.]|nr:PRD domain-containing protein [Arthrobacter sp.]